LSRWVRERGAPDVVAAAAAAAEAAWAGGARVTRVDDRRSANEARRATSDRRALRRDRRALVDVDRNNNRVDFGEDGAASLLRTVVMLVVVRRRQLPLAAARDDAAANGHFAANGTSAAGQDADWKASTLLLFDAAMVTVATRAVDRVGFTIVTLLLRLSR